MSLFFLWFTKGRNRKENHIEILGTKQAIKETACVWLASPISSRLRSRQLRKACRLLKNPAGPCLVFGKALSL